jgi:DNA ligase-1
MMLANRWKGQDPTGWWVSEKLDGCRAFWDGHVLRTRDSWLPIYAPASLTAKLPRGIALDGELWGGRGTFQMVRVLVQTNRPTHANWQGVRYMVFDAPTVEDVPWEQRQRRAAMLARRAGAGIVEHWRCTGLDAMQADFRRIVAAGGEGLMLRRPGHCYAFQRSSSWLKVKPGRD